MCVHCWDITGVCQTLPSCSAYASAHTIKSTMHVREDHSDDIFVNDFESTATTVLLKKLSEENERLKKDLAVKDKDIIDLKVWYANLGTINDKLNKELEALKEQNTQTTEDFIYKCQLGLADKITPGKDKEKSYNCNTCKGLKKIQVRQFPLYIVSVGVSFPRYEIACPDCSKDAK